MSKEIIDYRDTLIYEEKGFYFITDFSGVKMYRFYQTTVEDVKFIFGVLKISPRCVDNLDALRTRVDIEMLDNDEVHYGEESFTLGNVILRRASPTRFNVEEYARGGSTIERWGPYVSFCNDTKRFVATGESRGSFKNKSHEVHFRETLKDLVEIVNGADVLVKANKEREKEHKKKIDEIPSNMTSTDPHRVKKINYYHPMELLMGGFAENPDGFPEVDSRTFSFEEVKEMLRMQRVLDNKS